MLTPRHVLESQQFDRPLLERLFGQTIEMRSMLATPAGRVQLRERHAGKQALSLFFEPSTRTQTSWWCAATNLGMVVDQPADPETFSSFKKGESISDALTVYGGYGFSAIFMRHPRNGAVGEAAQALDTCASPAVIINCGDGSGQHPTQSLLDLFTINDECNRIDGLRVAIVGDLKHGRTARSLAYLLTKFSDVEIDFVSPPELVMGRDVCEHLDSHRTVYREVSHFAQALPQADVVYLTRVQRERMTPELYDRVNGSYVFGTEQLAMLKQTARVLHPLPRVGEVDIAVDADPRCAYFRQAWNGVPMRMALLDLVLRGE